MTAPRTRTFTSPHSPSKTGVNALLPGEVDHRRHADDDRVGGDNELSRMPASTPHPSPPPQGRREQTSRGDRGEDKRARNHQQRKRDKRDVHGWLVLDKPIGMTST